MILVTGATGKVGSELIQSLQEGKAKFRALVHKPEDVARLGKLGVDAVAGDLGKRETLAPAFRGVDHLFLLSPPSPQSAVFAENLLQEAKLAGVEHVVRLSALGASPESACRFLGDHARIEQRIEQLGFGFTHLRPAMFFQNFLWFDAPAIKSQGAIYAPAGDARTGFIDTRDIAAVAAKVLTEPGHLGRTYELTGPEALSWADVAARFSAVLEKKVQYVAVPDGAAYQSMLGMGLPPEMAYNMVALFQTIRKAGPFVSGCGELVTGKPARTFDAFLRENRKAFLA
ncbi:MAG: SDR family oxidoreductase [Deltaproteobacteria bacterium]|nr:SDR family oxidoreductase [Deltaproteobacteria bacterium]